MPFSIEKIWDIFTLKVILFNFKDWGLVTKKKKKKWGLGFKTNNFRVYCYILMFLILCLRV